MGTEIIEVERGSFITSELKLSDRWGWSRHKVRDFLTLLERDSMLVRKTDSKRTALKVVKYDVWQDSATDKGQQKDNKRTTKGQRKDTNKNEKNEKNEEEVNNKTALDSAIDDFIQFRKQSKKPMTDKAVKLIREKLDKMASDDDTKIAILNQSIEQGWTGIYPLKTDKQIKPIGANFEQRKDIKYEYDV
jgi:predicted transcriptional regulator